MQECLVLEEISCETNSFSDLYDVDGDLLCWKSGAGAACGNRLRAEDGDAEKLDGR